MRKARKKIDQLDKAIDQTILRVKEQFNLFDPVIIFPFRGYGNNEMATISGRILEKESVLHEDENFNNGLFHQLYKVFKRYETDEIPYVQLEGKFAGETIQTQTDDDGYFEMEFNIKGKNISNGWHKVNFKIIGMPFDIDFEESAEGEILINDQKECFAIISDVDDTIIKSYAKDTSKKLLTLLLRNSKERTPFEGVSELYKALINNGKNPLFFISGSSYNLYDLLVKFCTLHDIPKAPFLLRNLGLTANQWLKQDTSPYKKEYINKLFNTYPKLQFILIGDSGQKDPEIYFDVYQEHAQQIKGIFIRHVGSEERKEEIKKISSKIDIDLLLIDKSDDVLAYCKEKEWV